MAKERICPDCGKKTRTVGPFCPYCKAELTPITEPEENENIKKEGNFIMKPFNYVLGALFIVALAAFFILFPILPVALGIWGIFTLIGLGLIILGLTFGLINVFVPKDILVKLRKLGTILGSIILSIALITGGANYFLHRGTTTVNGDLHVTGKLTVDGDTNIKGNLNVAKTATADQVVANEVDANKVVANEVDANKVVTKEVVTEKVTIVKEVPTVTPKTPSNPTPTTPTAPATPDVPKITDLSQHFGKTSTSGIFKITIPADGFVSGDCILNDVKLYDDSEKTFLVFSVKKGDVVSCNWTAYYSNLVTFDEMKALAANNNPGQTLQP